MFELVDEAIIAAQKALEDFEPQLYKGTDAKHLVERFAQAAACPEREENLLSSASRHGLQGLKEECARVRAAALPDELERHEKIRRRRHLRHWTDPDGAFRLQALLTPEAGARVMAALEPIKDQVFNEARKQGRREPYEAYGADALVQMAEATTGGDQSSGNKPKTTVHVRVDHTALVRGVAAADEICEIVGVGPIPVATARALAEDAWVCALVTDGEDIKAVTSMKKTISARLRRAVEERDQTCAVPGCDVRHHLEIDHTLPRHQKGPTQLDNLDRLCKWHHYLKTHRGYGWVGPRGNRVWRGPPDRDSP